jgi:hypothetical protein
MAIRGLGAVSGIHPDKLAALQRLASGAPPATPGPTEGVVTGKPVKRKPSKPASATAARPGTGSDLLTRIAERIMAERRAKQRGTYLR